MAVLGRFREGVSRGAEQAARNQARAGVSGVQRIHRSQDAHAHELYPVGDAHLLRALPGKGERQTKKQKLPRIISNGIGLDGGVACERNHEESVLPSVLPSSLGIVFFFGGRDRSIAGFVGVVRVHGSNSPCGESPPDLLACLPTRLNVQAGVFVCGTLALAFSSEMMPTIFVTSRDTSRGQRVRLGPLIQPLARLTRAAVVDAAVAKQPKATRQLEVGRENVLCLGWPGRDGQNDGIISTMMVFTPCVWPDAVLHRRW